EIGERTGLQRRPDLEPSARRLQSGVGENGIIVKVKARTKRSAKGNRPGGEQNQARSHDQLRAYVKPPKTAAARQARLAEILSHLDRMYPDATCALLHRDPWELLVATILSAQCTDKRVNEGTPGLFRRAPRNVLVPTILSAQCTDKRVNEVTPGLFAKYPTPRDFAAVRPEVLADDIRSTGFFNNKAKSIVGAAQRVVGEFGGVVPKTMEEMLTVPGAARKTANVVLGTAYGIASGVVVDTHVSRI